MQWNEIDTAKMEKMVCETVKLKGYNGDEIHAYVARPDDGAKHPGVVLVHHMPGWDELFREFARRFAQHGYVTICTDLYCRAGHGSPDDVTAKIRADGGVSDDSVVGDSEAALNWLKARPDSNGKVGITGTCSGGRNAYLVACRTKKFDAVADLWGGRVVAAKEDLTAKQPVAPIDYTKDLNCPLLGLFGNDDQGPSPEQVNIHEAELKKQGKNYEFHRYDGAGHAFFYHDRPAYRQQQAMDGWSKLFAFFDKNLA
jgi:carboxymethylenebutenolidase